MIIGRQRGYKAATKKANAQSKNSGILESVGHELKENPPKILAKTRAKFGAADAKKQRTAILLSKARKAGANIPVKGGT